LPVAYIKLKLKLNLRDFGLSAGDWRFGLKFILFVIPLIIVPVIYFASSMEDLIIEYPLSKAIISQHELIIFYELAYVLLFYVAWEFYFRGFLLFGLRKHFGDTSAVLIQTIASCLIHIGKPEGEIIGSIIIGIIFGYIALRTRSVWYVFIMHACIGVFTDLFIIF